MAGPRAPAEHAGHHRTQRATSHNKRPAECRLAGSTTGGAGAVAQNLRADLRLPCSTTEEEIVEQRLEGGKIAGFKFRMTSCP